MKKGAIENSGTDEDEIDVKAKRKKPLSDKIGWLKLLKQGKLISSIILEGESASLVLHEAYDKKEYYLKINKSLHDLHIANKNFQKYFKRPAIPSHAPTTLVTNGVKNYNSGDEILSDLMLIAARKPINIEGATKAIPEVVPEVAPELIAENVNNLFFMYQPEPLASEFFSDENILPLDSLFDGQIEEWLAPPAFDPLGPFEHAPIEPLEPIGSLEDVVLSDLPPTPKVEKPQPVIRKLNVKFVLKKK